MEKAAQRKSYRDPALNKIVQEKARWNREVSTLINDIIHFKKSMNGWPSKYYKERTRITQPAPIDLTGILGGLATKFQDLANEGNGIIQEQSEFARSRVKRQSERAQQKLEERHGPAEGPAPTPAAPKPDLTQQLQKGLAASEHDSPLIKLAAELEDKYTLEALASNPFSRFITRLFNPKFGFGEGARIRRLRMTMLDYCVKSYKELKRLHKEIVKSGKGSIINSHKMMSSVWNFWNAVNRIFATYKTIRPQEVKDEGGPIADTERAKEKAVEKGQPATAIKVPSTSAARLDDFRAASGYLGGISMAPSLHELNSIAESIQTATAEQKAQVILDSNFDALYVKTLQDLNNELGTSGKNFREIMVQMQSKPAEKTAQRQLGRLRHQILPGATSGQRLEIYDLITQIRRDLNEVMDLLEKGFDQAALTNSIGRVNRDMVALRTMLRSLYYSEKPEEASSPFF